MKLNLDLNIKIGENAPKNVVVITVHEPESGEDATFTGTIRSDGQMNPELAQLILQELESWISLEMDKEDESK